MFGQASIAPACWAEVLLKEQQLAKPAGEVSSNHMTCFCFHQVQTTTTEGGNNVGRLRTGAFRLFFQTLCNKSWEKGLYLTVEWPYTLSFFNPPSPILVTGIESKSKRDFTPQPFITSTCGGALPLTRNEVVERGGWVDGSGVRQGSHSHWGRTHPPTLRR